MQKGPKGRQKGCMMYTVHTGMLCLWGEKSFWGEGEGVAGWRRMVLGPIYPMNPFRQVSNGLSADPPVAILHQSLHIGSDIIPPPRGNQSIFNPLWLIFAFFLVLHTFYPFMFNFSLIFPLSSFFFLSYLFSPT
jgi:hypothetical protein